MFHEKGKANLILDMIGKSVKLHTTLAKMRGFVFIAGWPQFAAQHKIGDGSVLLILFHKDNGDRLCVSFNRL